jgi:hypothetical protein
MIGGPLGTKIGSAIGSLAGGLVSGFKKLFGIGINDEVKKANKEIEVLRRNLLVTYGGLDKLEEAANKVGLSFKAAWGHQGQEGLKQFNELIAEFEKRLGESKAALEEMKDTLEGELSDARSELERLNDEAENMGYIFDKNGDFVETTLDAVKKKAEEVGIPLESLGKKFQGQKLAADAKGIVDAFTLLSKAGTDAGTILFGLKDEIGHLVSDSIKFKTTIPENMRPWIQNLIDTGQLIDDDGQKITDMAAINFGPPIDSEFDIVQRAIKDTISAINDLIGRIDALISQILSIPDKNVKIHYDVDRPPDLSEPWPSPDEWMPTARGGLFTHASRRLVGEAGPELVGPVDFMAAAIAGAMGRIGGMIVPDLSALSPALAGAGGDGGATTQIINNFEFNVSTLDTDEMSRLVRRRVMPEINSQLSNVGELRSANRDALGI